MNPTYISITFFRKTTATLLLTNTTPTQRTTTTTTKMSADPNELIRQAEKLSTPQSKLASFFSGGNSSRLEEAAERYIQAANAFRVQKDGRSAGQTFEKAAACQEQTEVKEDAANTYVEAFKSYKQTDPEDAARCLEKAVVSFTSRGQFRRAANYKMDLGGIYEQLDRQSEAVDAYKTAGDWYVQDQASALGNKAYLKVAEISALNGDYGTAIESYDTVAQASMNDNLTKWGLKDHFLRAGLCRLAREDVVDADRCIHQYIEWDQGFAQTRECQFLQDLINAVKEGDEEEFSSKAQEFDQFSKLDKWKTTMLLRIKEKIANAEDDLL